MTSVLAAVAGANCFDWALVRLDGAVVGTGEAGDAPAEVVELVRSKLPSFVAVSADASTAWCAGLVSGVAVALGSTLVDPELTEHDELDAVALGRRVAAVVRRGGRVACSWATQRTSAVAS